MHCIKLNKLNTEQLTQIKGGKNTYLYCGENFPHYSCGCGCYYENDGGSSTNANFNANLGLGIMTKIREGYEPVLYCPK